MNNLENEICSIISDFLIYNDDLVIEQGHRYTIKIVGDIYQAVLIDDRKYALEATNLSSDTYGLFYVNKKNELILFVKITDFDNIKNTLLHEFVHLIDYMKLAKSRNIYDFRVLQEDYIFIILSEFHAEYYTYKYLIAKDKKNINPYSLAENIRDHLVDYFNTETVLDFKTTLDRTVRAYGHYIALETHFPNELPKHPQNFYRNQSFLWLYDFLYDYDFDDSLEKNYQDLVALINELR